MATVYPVASSPSTKAIDIAASDLSPRVSNRRTSSVVIVTPCRQETTYPSPHRSRSTVARTTTCSQAKTAHPNTFSRGEHCLDALNSLRQLALDNCASSLGYSLGVAVSCCATLGAVRAGKELHAVFLRRRFEDVNPQHVESSLVDFYSKCGLIRHARVVFDGMLDKDVVAWTIMLAAYTEAECCEHDMWDFFDQILVSGIDLNHYTFSTVLRCAGLEEGQQVHCQVVKRGRWDWDTYVGSALVDVYARNGALGSAKQVFDRIVNKDVICFNGLITGYGRVGDAKGFFSTFEEMYVAEFRPNQSTYVGMLNGCANSGSLRLAKQLHGNITTTGYAQDQRVKTVLIDAYAKCGDLESARMVFDHMGEDRTVFVWNTMFAGYGKHGYGEEAIRVFHRMELASVPPDHITFTSLLSACSHSGMYREGWALFNSMVKTYGITPRNEHYSCMVDLMGRAGMVDEAYEFIRTIKREVGASVWGSLLSASRDWGKVELAEIAARELFELEPGSASTYISLSGLLQSHGHHSDATMVRDLIDARKIKKVAGCSWIEVEGVVHRFQAGDEW